jgi:hypothetical protein
MTRLPSLALTAVLVITIPLRADFTVHPPAVTLDGNFARAQLVVTEHAAGGSPDRAGDLTGRAAYATSNPAVVTVSPSGQLLAAGNGEAVLTVTASGLTRQVPVKVASVLPAARVRFDDQVLPLLSKAGCNMGACHASQYGKGGLKLSVFGSQPAADHLALARDRFGRRVNPLDPDQSLFLLKATVAVPHGGGKRIDKGSVDYGLLRAWAAAGASGPAGNPPHVTALRVEPTRRVGPPGFTQQLRAVAIYSDKTERDVTHWAKFDSTEEGVVAVTRTGLATALARGQGAVMVRYEGRAELATVIVPGGAPADLTGWTENNFIDRLAAVKFREIGVSPSPLCDDATFLRRVSLDATGTLPTPAPAVAFLDSTDPEKRKKLVDRLLGLTGDPAQDVHTNAYAAWWALKWADLLRNSGAGEREEGMWAMHNWLLASFRDNKRLDRFAREVLTARGTNVADGPTNFFLTFANPQQRTEAVAQIFLGVRVQCAQCHHHPFETISQADYHAFSAFFVRVVSKPTSDYGQQYNPFAVLDGFAGEATHPKTGQVLAPKPLYGEPLKDAPDRRRALADWLTGAGRRHFARNIVNRYWGYLFGRGLVMPLDDLRQTNPPTNPELLDALADHFIATGYDARQLLRTLMTSRLYQLDSQPTRANAADQLFHSHYYVKRLAAEALLDAVDAVAESRTKFPKVPLGTRAIELPDASYDNDLLKVFGKPKREQVCECERVSEPNLAQALHTLNNDVLAGKIAAPKGRIARLLAAKKAPEEIVTELYLACLSRRPSPAELALARQLLAEAGDPAAAYQDLLWSLLNSKEFLFVH